MKKRICCALLGALCLFQLTSCGNKGAEPAGGNATPQNAEANILKEMELANSDEALLAKYDKVALRFTCTFADETVISEYCYQDADRYVQEWDNYVEIDENGDVYGFNPEMKRAYRSVFIEDTYADYKNEYGGLLNYSYDDEEAILSQEEKDGIVTLCTKLEDKDIVNEYSGYYLFEEGAVDHFEFSYKVDAQTDEIIEYIQFAVLTDGTKWNVVDCERVLNPETYVVDEQLKECIFGGEPRTTTITAYPGSDQETIYTQTVSKGSGFDIHIPNGHQLYTDAECTTPFKETHDQTIDVNLYYK